MITGMRSFHLQFLHRAALRLDLPAPAVVPLGYFAAGRGSLARQLALSQLALAGVSAGWGPLEVVKLMTIRLVVAREGAVAAADSADVFAAVVALAVAVLAAFAARLAAVAARNLGSARVRSCFMYLPMAWSAKATVSLWMS